MAELGRRVDELEGDLLLGVPAGLVHQSFTHGDQAAPHTRACTLDHDVVLVHLTIVRESTKWRNALDREVKLCGGMVLHAITDLVHLLVELCTMMVTILTRTSNRVLDAGRMPGADTGDLTKTLVGLTGQLGNTPTGDDTFESLTLGDGNGVDHLVLLEDTTDSDRFLKERSGECDLVGHGAAVDLNLADVGLLLAEVHFADLCVADNTEDGAVLLETLLLGFDASALSVLFRVASEGLVLLRCTPVLVEPALALVAEMLSPDSAEGLEATRGLEVSHHTHDHHGRGLDDCDCLHNLLLVSLRPGLVDITEDVGAPSLVAHESCQVRLRVCVINWEALNLALCFCASLLGQESERAMARRFKLAVRHGGRNPM